MAKQRWHKNATPHRTLRLASDPQQGRDVRGVQRAIQRFVRDHPRLGLVAPVVDGVYGKETAKALGLVAWLLGITNDPDKTTFSASKQALVRSPKLRTPVQRQRGKKRRAERRRAISKAGQRPNIIRLDAPMVNRFGGIGPFLGLVGHYTAGPRDTNDKHGLALFKQYNAQHRSQGWGAIGYHLGILSSGTLVLLRPTSWKGAHVANHNTGRIGVVVNGGPGQRMTREQLTTWRWIKENGHTTAMPASHRLPAKVTKVWVHKDLYPTACPGTYEKDYKS